MPEPPRAAPKTALTAHSGEPLSIPPILLEGDLPASPPVSGPGARYALAPQAVTSRFPMSGGELPESYGTQRMFLAARDPHWLYASWDIPVEQQRENNSRSRDGHMLLRVFAEDEEKSAVPEIHLHPESRNWFVNVPRAGTHYRAEVGYYSPAGEWSAVSASQSTFSPPDTPSNEVAAEFATIPPEVTFQEVVEMVQEFVTQNEPLLEAVVRANEAARASESPAQPRANGEQISAHTFESGAQHAGATRRQHDETPTGRRNPPQPKSIDDRNAVVGRGE
ncbi:MAG TPA: DUF4912 domain-containing protein, partial [Verrucomicrobiae bacterium]|nr:DUF4912 domain-containing protein [Verrucomicrobiae bacterium]